MRTLSGRKRTLRRAKFVMNSGRTYQTECIVEDAADHYIEQGDIELYYREMSPANWG